MNTFSNSTAGLKSNLENSDNKIIVTTIQKLNNLMKSEDSLPVYQKPVIFIFDECHRSQFGEAQKNLKKIKQFCQFGFTGTPIFPDNALGAETTLGVFGCELHSYVITDAIRDEKVLKFKVDYNDTRPQFQSLESEQDEKKLTAAENRQALLHPERIHNIAEYILQHFREKTHRLNAGGKGFNAMFAVSSIEAAKSYYQAFKEQQAGKDNPLKVATIFSFAANEEQNAIGEIVDETFEPTAMENSGVMDKIGVKNRCSPYAARLYARSKPLNTKNAFSAAPNRSGKMAPKMANNATDVCPVTSVSAAGKS